MIQAFSKALELHPNDADLIVMQPAISKTKQRKKKEGQSIFAVTCRLLLSAFYLATTGPPTAEAASQINPSYVCLVQPRPSRNHAQVLSLTAYSVKNCLAVLHFIA